MMQTTGNAVVSDKTDKTGEKVVEKRRALGRGLESLLPGPRVVSAPDPTLAQHTREGGAAIDDETALSADGGRAGAPVAPFSDEGAGATVDLQAAAERGRGQAVVEIALGQIDHNPHQTRSFFDPDLLEELTDSIRVQGVIQPIVVRPEGTGRYILILGERRLRASEAAGKTTIPAVVKRVSEQQAAEMTIVENLQRQDLECLEQAAAFAHLSRQFNLTQEQIGKRVGLSRETVSNYLRLLKLPAMVQTYLNRGELDYSHARQLLMLEDDAQILKMAEVAVKKKMSVVQLEEAIQDIHYPLHPEQEKKSGGARWVDPNVRAAQRNLEMILGMRVRIRDRKGKGKITIEYNTLEDYERVVGMLKGRSQ
jgi:ParB family chromosome partitioning protein